MNNDDQSMPIGLSLSDLLRVLRARKTLIALIFLICLLTTIVFTWSQPKWYNAIAGIRVEKPGSEVVLFGRQATGNFDPYFIREQVQIIQSKSVLAPVIVGFSLQKKLSAKLWGALTEEETYLYLIKKMLNVDSQPGTPLIDIGVLMQEEPVLAAELANAVAKAYARNRIAFATSGQTEAIEKLQEELLLQESAVSEQRDRVESLRKELQISGVDIAARTTQLDIENLRQLERSLIALKVDAIARKTRFERFSKVPLGERFRLVNSELIPDTNILNLMQAHMIADQNFTQLEGRLGEAHPDLVAASKNLQKISEQLANLLQGYEEALEISYIEAQARVSELEKQLESARIDQIYSAENKMRPFEEAVTRLQDEENLYKTLKITLRQREIDFQVPKHTIEILNEAVPARRPSKPNWVINLGLAIIMGSIIGLGSAFLFDFFDTSFRSIDDLERILQLPVMGVIKKDQPLVTADNFNTFEAEPYRVIQTNLNLSGNDKKSNVIIVQSAGPGEGKSSTLYNLASVMAFSGLKILVIDSDLYRPVQHKLMEAKRTPGLIDVLMGDKKPKSIIQHTKNPNLDVMPAGHSAHFNLSVIHVNLLIKILDELGSKYDKIFLDSPPIIGISDASILASVSDGVIIVIQHKRTTTSMSLRAQQILQNGEGNIYGVILNQVPEVGDEDYNYYTNNYSYYSSAGRQKESSSPFNTDNVVENEIETFEIEESDKKNFPSV